MGTLVSKPGITPASVLAIPQNWSPAWFRGLIANLLVGADVRNAIGSGGISISGNIASPYATIGFKAPVTLPSPVTINATSGNPTLNFTGTGAYSSVINMTAAGGGGAAIQINGGTAINIDSSHNVYIVYGQLYSENGASRLMMNDLGDGYLRLNQNRDFANGVYTPGNFRVDGIFSIGASNYSLYQTGQLGYPYGTFGTVGSTNGYGGLNLDQGSYKATVMSNGSSSGIYHQGTGAWAFYYSGNMVIFGTTVPSNDNTYSCGLPGNRWSVVYAATGTINTSDARLKTAVQDTNLGLDFINALRPVSYKWISGSQKVIKNNGPDKKPDTESVAGTRTHYGLLAQDVKAVLDKQNAGGDFAGWTLADKTDPESTQGLRYDQFIAPLIKAVQELSAQVAALQAKA